MAEFLTTKGTSYQIENIIVEAKSKLVLISPYLQLSNILFERLKDACKRNVSITIIYGKDELHPNVRSLLTDLEMVTLYFLQDLHAKCYFNEDLMVITSMNMYAYSEKNNREMGVLIKKKEDPELYQKAVAEYVSILQCSQKEELFKRVCSINNNIGFNTDKEFPPLNMEQGFCIRCQKRIPYNPSKAYCEKCYSSWSQHFNWEYKEKVCHHCGEFELTTIEKPECYECYATFMFEDTGSLDFSPIEHLHAELNQLFPDDRINKTQTYVYFINLTMGLDAFINLEKITLKSTSKAVDEYRINQLDSVLKENLLNTPIQLNPPKDNYRYWTWDIDLKYGHLVEITRILQSLKIIKLNM